MISLFTKKFLQWTILQGSKNNIWDCTLHWYSSIPKTHLPGKRTAPTFLITPTCLYTYKLYRHSMHSKHWILISPNFELSNKMFMYLDWSSLSRFMERKWSNWNEIICIAYQKKKRESVFLNFIMVSKIIIPLSLFL